MEDSTLPLRLRTLITPTPRPDKEAENRRLARQYFADAAYEDDARLRMFARAVWLLAYRRGHEDGRNEVQ